MATCFLALWACLLFVDLRPSECLALCSDNEEYVEAVNPCNTCLDKGDCSLKKLGSGCDCLPGYFRDDEGSCIEKNKCDEGDGKDLSSRTGALNVAVVCRKDEEYLRCGCQRTCCNGGKAQECASQCTAGCFCRPPLVREEDGSCVLLEDCRNREIIPCGENEIYKKCGTDCPETCSKKDKPQICTDQCVRGCFCKDGYIKNDDDKCVTPEECPNERCVVPPNSRTSCRKEEEYRKCGCERSCCNGGKAQECMPRCAEGCFCKAPLVRDQDGRCVYLEDCSNRGSSQCGPNAVYKKCGTACPETCSTRGKPQICTEQCVRGCFCKDGYIKNDDGECVKPRECPKVVLPCSVPSNAGTVCRKDEEYRKCSCQRTCCNGGKAQECKPKCTAGCFCKAPRVRDQDGSCVRLEECSNRETGQCGVNEIYKKCGTSCPQTCSNRNETQVCTYQCVRGCFCKDGYVRNDDRVCVEPNECPKVRCGRNEKYKECGSACPETCSNRGKPQVCTAQCVSGCFCKDGLIRNNDLDCVKPEECPTECGENEEYTGCGSACPLTCDNKDKNIICSQQCVPGCFCKGDLVLNRRGKCVEPSQCEKGQCGENEEYSTCGGACVKTCENKDENIFCTQQCVEGCFCKKGFVRNAKRECIDPSKCERKSCEENEEYNRCGTACPKTCENKDRNIICTLQCVPGCFCRRGLVRNAKGKCINPSECEIGQCGENEKYNGCGSACPKTCENKDKNIICTQQCVPGCFCKNGLVRNAQKKCVDPSKCEISKG